MTFLKNFIAIIYLKLNYLTILFIVIYTAAAIIVSLNRYWQYQAFYFDFGIFDMAIWKVAHFQLPVVDHYHWGNESRIFWADHFNPGIYLLSPLYWLTDRREIILVAQSLAVGISAFIAYVIAKKNLINKIVILSLIIAYLGYIGLQNALISDFHETTVVVLPLMLTFWAVINKKWKLYFLFLLITLSFKENFFGMGIGMGLYLFFSDRRSYKQAFMTILLSFFWGLLVYKIIIPYFNQGVGSSYVAEIISLSPLEFIESFFDTDLKWKTVFITFLNFGFLPLFNLPILPMVIDNFLERFLLPEQSRWDLGMHYNAVLSPMMFMGALSVFGFLEKKKNFIFFTTSYALLIIFIVFCLHRFILRGPLGLVYNPVFYQQNDGVKYVDNFVTQFPKNGLIMTQNDLALRLTHQNVKLLRENYAVLNPDYIILNLTPGQNINSFYPLSFDQAMQMRNRLMLDKNYKVNKYADELYIFSKN